MHRRPLLELLDRYAVRHPDAAVVGRFRSFVVDRPDCLERTCIPGHITASSWIVSPDGSQALLTHHKKLGRWLQLGGHIDGEIDLSRAALREAQEESGIEVFETIAGTETDPLDLDIHRIPAHGNDPAHDHLDVRFLLRAGTDEIRISDESNDLRWFRWEEIPEVTGEESVLRLMRKATLRMKS